MVRITISKKLLNAILQNKEKRFVLARKANLHPDLFSKIVNKHIPLKKNDPRVLRIGKVLNIPQKDLFEIEEVKPIESDNFTMANDVQAVSM